METAILINVVSIHILVILTFVLVLRARRSHVSVGPVTRPIRHQKIEGPTTAKMTREIGYWRPKDEPDAEPFLAAWYEKDTTIDVRDTDSGDAPIPADTFVDLTGRRIAGDAFRAFYVPAEEVVIVNKVKTKTKRSDLVTGKDAPKLTPEEEQKLADEYELGSTTEREIERRDP
jgi:hypothetical protein